MSSCPVAGVRVGHRTGAATGVTVMLLPAGSVASAELRGGAPATRELDVLDPVRTVARADAVVFSGGSAFGLATASGVMRYFAERGQGFPTAGGPVPIVPTACIFDLVETSGPRPGETDGYEACVAAARDEPLAIGRVGAGAGATVGKWQGRDHAVDGGLGVASKEIDGVTVAALAVVNAAGDVVAADGSVIAGSTAPPGTAAFEHPDPFEEDRGNTTLAVVVTDALLDKASCFVLAQAAHDGFARALRPAHTRFDGDVAIAVATGSRPVDPSANVDRIALVAADVVAGAIRAACAGGNSGSSG